MRTRIIALVVAVALAVAGGVLLVGYVQGADLRAADGAELTSVLIVVGDVSAGTAADSLGLLVEERSIPSAFLADGAITGLDELADLDGLVTTSALVPGEQVIGDRFATPDAFVGGGGTVPVPEGMQEISVSLDSSRVLGGLLAPGDIVGAFVSVEGDGGAVARQTKLIFDDLLVTGVGGGAAASAEAGALTGTVTITLAVTEEQAQSIIYSREFAQLWFSRQNGTTTPTTGESYGLQDLVG